MISYCTTCKGRLWQLELTLPVNVKKLVPGESELILLDYHSNDPVKQYLEAVHPEAIIDGRIKYYRLVEDQPFHMAHAKNVAHLLASGDLLFNLDADNFIGTTIDELKALDKLEILVHRTVNRSLNNGCTGRVGIHRTVFKAMRGYDEVNFQGMGGDDGDFIHRAKFIGIRPVKSTDDTIPIQQPLEAKLAHVADKSTYYNNSKYIYVHHKVNKSGYGIAKVVDFDGNVIEVGEV